jgi:hypothetical protein|eukprot:6113976-Prymnesium_polylepis.1
MSGSWERSHLSGRPVHRPPVGERDDDGQHEALTTCGGDRNTRLCHLGMRRTVRKAARCHPSTLTAVRAQRRRAHVGVSRKIKNWLTPQMSAPLTARRINRRSLHGRSRHTVVQPDRSTQGLGGECDMDERAEEKSTETRGECAHVKCSPNRPSCSSDGCAHPRTSLEVG